MLLTGSAGGGKSRLAAEKLNAYMLKYPKAMGLMVRKTRESMTNSTTLFFDHAIIGTQGVRHVQTKHRFEYDNGSILAYGGMADDKQREQIRSIGQDGGLDFVWMEEANRFTEDDYNEILPRLRGKAGTWRQIILSTNPDAPTHWINQRLILGGGAKAFYSSAADNPHNPEDYRATLRSLTGVLRTRLLEGKWAMAEGLVYDGYDQDTQLIERFPIPPEWRRMRAIDFGYTNPLVCQWWAIDGDGRAYRYREIYMTQRICEDHAKHILELSKGERIEVTVADHDAEDRATLQRHGIITQAARKDVSVGLQAVANRHRKAGDGKPRLFFLKGSLVEVDRSLESKHLPTCTEEEILQYAWPRTTDGKPLKEEPVKANDHGCDAARYMMMQIDGGIEPRVRYL